MAISVTVCNLALGELRAARITDIDEGSTESAWCKEFYPQCLRRLLERYEWSFANRVAMLAELSDNPRASEWAHAYAMPGDVAAPSRLVPPLTGWTPLTSLPPAAVLMPFIIENDVLFSQAPGAILEYSANSLDEAMMPALFVDALAYSLASRLAVPLRDSTTLKGQLLQQAELAEQRAIAADMNRQPQRLNDSEDEISAARSGGYGCDYPEMRGRY